MIVARTIQELEGVIAGSCVTIGNFDGVHLGHQKLIGLTCRRARALGLVSVVLTFEPHPLRVLLGRATPPFITLLEQKLELLAAQGPDVTLVLEFTREMAGLSPEAFVRRYLVDGLNVRELFIGYDYAMGKGRSGNYETLKELGAALGFRVERLEPVTLGDAIVSSTRIRDLVQAGEVWEARPLLGRFYQVRGTVVHGHDRGGKLLGFPTANLLLVDELVPKTGVYAVWVEVDRTLLPGVANIGTNPTFGNEAVSVEAHVLNFQGDLYERDIRVHFVQRIRSERKFESLEALRERISADIVLAGRILEEPEAHPAGTAYASGPATDSGRKAR